jgi:hypothetical protein
MTVIWASQQASWRLYFCRRFVYFGADGHVLTSFASWRCLNHA